MIVRHEPEGGVLSNAVEANGFVFLAGSVADDLSLDIEGQTRQALDYIDTMLARCGTSKSRIVSATVWITDTANMAGYNKVWKAWIDPDNLPARATTVAGLYDPRCLVEIMVIAAK